MRTILFLFYQSGNGGMERLTILPKVLNTERGMGENDVRDQFLTYSAISSNKRALC